MGAVPTISPAALKALYDANPALNVIDVRTPAEFKSIHVPFARLMPLETLDPKRVADETSPGTIYVLCRTGERARMASRKLVESGYDDVCVVEGGTLAWQAAGFPVVQGGNVISLERQVRIAAGSLVLIGLILGFKVHPGFFGLSAFVGCGLVFAGVTDTCGLGMLLALAPWNQRGRGQASTCAPSTGKKPSPNP